MAAEAIAQRRCTIFVQVPEPGWIITWDSKGQHLCCFPKVLKPFFLQNTLKTDQGHKNFLNKNSVIICVVF